YTIENLRREYKTKKGCAPHCTVSCVHQTSMMDFWRDPQTIQTGAPPKQEAELVQIQAGGR
ncbi:MAG: radical SAM protein, partial [Acidobacteriota bacterium]